MDVTSEIEKLRKLQIVTETELQRKDELLSQQSLKLQDQMYWSQTYQKNCTVLNEQLQKQTNNIEEMVNSLQNYKSAFVQLSEKLSENESLCVETVELVKTQIDEACSFMEKSISDFQSKAQASISGLEAKKHKREKQNYKIQQTADKISQNQAILKTEVVDLWPKSLQKINDEIKGCQEQYLKLKEATEGAIETQFDEIKAQAAENQKQYLQEQEKQKQDHQMSTEVFKKEKERLMERKRKLEDLKTEVEQKEQVAMEKIQQNATQIFQQVLEQCLQQALPQISQSIASSLQPQRTVLTDCSTIVQVSPFQSTFHFLRYPAGAGNSSGEIRRTRESRSGP